MTQDVIGAVVAFMGACGATYLDCYQVVRKAAWRVPSQFWQSVPLGFLAFGCGGFAVGAFIYSLSGDAGFLDVLLGSAISNHIVRGFYTGAAVLALIRSKVFQVRGADIGLEYAYVELRSICLRGINVTWMAWRNRYVNENITSLVNQMGREPTFDDQLADLIRAAVMNADEKTKNSVETQLVGILAGRPAGPLVVTDRAWAAYCRALFNLSLENCGKKPVEKLLG